MATATFQKSRAFFRTEKLQPQSFGGDTTSIDGDTTSIDGGTAFKTDSGFRITALEEWHAKVRLSRHLRRKQSASGGGGTKVAHQNGTAQQPRTATIPKTTKTTKPEPVRTDEVAEDPQEPTTAKAAVLTPNERSSSNRQHERVTEATASSSTPVPSLSTPAEPPREARLPSTSAPEDNQPHREHQHELAPSDPVEEPRIRPATPPGKGKGLITTSADIPSFKAKVPLPMLERLKTASLVAHLDVQAHPALATRADREKLKDFSTFLSPVKNQMNLFRKQLPRCRHHLVQVTMPGQTSPETFICIEGLTDTNDIRTFHKVMSQTRYQSLYHPWRLCYEASEIHRPASDAETIEEPWSLHAETFCGRLLRSELSLASWVSTTGGLIEIDGEIFAMTTAHSPHQELPYPDDQTFDAESSPTQTLVNEDFPDDAYPAYILAQVGQPTGQRDDGPEAHESRYPPPLVTSGNVVALEQHDIKLMTVDPSHQLPNLIRVDRWQSDTPSGTLYVDGLCDDPAGMRAAAATGMSGTCLGRITHSPSFIIEGGKKPEEVWTMILDDGINLRQGDSGSWVGTLPRGPRQDRTSQVIGSVTASSQGRAHIRLLQQQFEDILGAIPSAKNVGLPSPLIAWLDSARSESRDISIYEMLDYTFAMRGRDIFATALAGLLDSASHQQRVDLARLLSLNGRDLRDVLDGSANKALVLEAPGQPGEQPYSLGPTWQKLATAFWEARDRVVLKDSGRPPSAHQADAELKITPAAPKTNLSFWGKPLRLTEAKEDHPPPQPTTEPKPSELLDGPQRPQAPGIDAWDAEMSIEPRSRWAYMWILHGFVSSVIGAVIAGVAWHQRYHGESGYPFAAREGAVAGAISGALTALLICVDLLSEYTAPQNRLLTLWGSVWSGVATIALTFARPLLVTLYLSSLITTSQPSSVFYSSAAVASLPLLGSSAYIRSALHRTAQGRGVVNIAVSLSLIFAFEIITATVFVAMSIQLGADLLSYEAAIATTAIFASVALLWPLAAFPVTFPVIWFLFRNRLVKIDKKMQARANEMERRRRAQELV